MSWYDGLSEIVDSVGGAWASIEHASSASPDAHKDNTPIKGENSDGSTLVATTPTQWVAKTPAAVWIGGGALLLLTLYLLGGKK